MTAWLVTSAATLLESTPFIIAAAALVRLPLLRGASLVPYLGCGCGAGPSARSLPAAAAAWLVFGPAVAALRFAAGFLVARLFRRTGACAHDRGSVLDDLHTLVPVALSGAGVALLSGAVFGMHPPPALAALGGAVAAFAMAPCALGAAGFAAVLRATSPAACAGFLCVAGIADARTWIARKHAQPSHDACAYAIACLACAIAAMHGGAGLVHPAIALALYPCALSCAFLAFVHRGRQCAVSRIAPLVMLAGVVLGAPPPQYHATETTLADAFAGERIDFTGTIVRTGVDVALVRYAITCCRADAAPIAVRLAPPLPRRLSPWMHARGVLVTRGGELQLRADSLQPAAPPRDPFLYY